MPLTQSRPFLHSLPLVAILQYPEEATIKHYTMNNFPTFFREAGNKNRMQKDRMKYILFSIFLLSGAFATAQPKYNIVHILAADVGYSDFGCYGNKDIKTPNIDALAQVLL
jgi:hypothetical protein